MAYTLESYRALIETALEHRIPLTSCPQGVILEAMRYSALGGGKRIRAILTLELCAALGGEVLDAMDAACALEMVHAYSLIHDDLPCMDNDDLRRGKPTSHRKFGEATAVLAGDGLLTLAFEVLSDEAALTHLGPQRALACVRVLAQAAGEYGMLGGQTVDVLNEGIALDEAGQHHMVALKTGALIGAAAHLGCICANATAEQTVLALEFAKNLGLAFQITDDLLDVTANTATLGKTAGKDEKQHKNTFVSLYGFEKAAALSKTLHQQALTQLDVLCPNSTLLKELTNILAQRTF